NLRYRLWQECAPRQQPYEQQSPKEEQGYGVIVFGIARAQETLDVLIDEVKPEKSSRLSGGRVTQPREDVPGCGNQEENRRAGEQAQAKQMTKVSRQQKKNKNNPN